MPKFSYVLSDRSGQKEEGVISASSKQIALSKLRKKDKIIISVIEEAKRKWFMGKPKLSAQDKMVFVKNLSTMVKVGITLTESLEIVASQSEKKSVKKMYENILEMISAGQSFSNSLRKYSDVFSELFVNMIETGEKSGNLDKVLQYLDVQLEKEYEIRKKVISAFIYPAVIVSLTLVIAIGIVIFIMPKITRIFSTFNMDLPLPTRVLIGLSEAMTQSPIYSSLVAVGAVLFFVFIFKIKILKPFWQKVALRVPVFGKILIASNVARFSRTFNSLLGATVPISEAMVISANMLANSSYKKVLLEASEKIEKGGHLGESLEPHKRLFPIMASKMFYIGEKSGSLEMTTERVAQLYEKIVDTKVKNLSVLLEPLLLVFMATLVGGIALSIILPIYQLPSMLNR